MGPVSTSQTPRLGTRGWEKKMAMIGNLNAQDVAQYIDYTSEVLEAAKECGFDYWLVVKLSARKAALVTGNGVNLVPSYETILARKDFDGEPEFYL
jgi:hypothetical protein